MTPEQYESCKQALLTAQHRIRTAQGYGSAYWMLHMLEARVLVDSALIQLEYAKKAVTEGDRRNN